MPTIRYSCLPDAAISKGAGVCKLQRPMSKMVLPEMHFFGNIRKIAITLFMAFSSAPKSLMPVAHAEKIAFTGPTSRVLFYHGPTFHCTSSALFSAASTVIHIMLPTLLGTNKTYLGASVAK
jgi:hypothetical protein